MFICIRIIIFSLFLNDIEEANVIERVHLQFCKRQLGVKKSTQNDFVYGELERTTLIIKRYVSIIKYRFKIHMSSENKYINFTFKIMF